jgi:nucleoside-diphosphate-sugar epimerase
MGFIENNKALCMLSVQINTHLLLAAREMGVKRYIFASSACVYNADKQRSAHVAPLKEEDAYPVAVLQRVQGAYRASGLSSPAYFLSAMAVSFSVAACHSRSSLTACLPMAPVANVLPSGEKATAETNMTLELIWP